MKKIKLSFLFILIVINLSSIDDYTEPVLHKLPENVISERPALDRDSPQGDEIINPAEFGRVNGVFLAWSGWALDTIADIAYHVAEDDKVYMFVTNASQQSIAYAYLVAHNVNMQNVIFIQDSDIFNYSIWIRDYFPFYIYEDGMRAIIDHPAGGQTELAETVADEFDFSMYYLDLMHQGGNHISDGNGMGFCSSNIYEHNPGSPESVIRTKFQEFFGIDSLVVVEPMAGDGTGHIDMFCKLLNDTLFVVGEYATPEDSYPGDYDLLNDLADYLETIQNLDGRDFRVERLPMPPFTYGGPAGTINYTYTNSLIINDKVLVPIYGFYSDGDALEIYSELMPGYDIIGIDSTYIIQYWGAIHCITNSHYSENPLIVFHDPLESVAYNYEPQIKFRLNPKFENANASVFYKLESDDEFSEIPAELNAGIWSSILPIMSENFEYYISGNATSGEEFFPAYLPENAPDSVFLVEIEPVSVSGESAKPKFVLSNFPNPFQSSTTISFFTAESGEDAEILIFNLKGQKVKTLECINSFDTKATESLSHITWNGIDDNNKPVSSGIYFYQLKSGGKFSSVKKMILMRKYLN